jgi:amino acid adenylation domain-containing protein/non-ribosomal peptide synthase protein (TIGR01720 family)
MLTDYILGIDKSQEYWMKKRPANVHTTQLSISSIENKQYTLSNIQNVLSFDSTDKLKKICKHNDASLFVLLQTVFKTVIYAYTTQKEIMIGSPLIKEKSEYNTQGLLGIVYCDLIIIEDRFRDFLINVAATTRESNEHQQYFVECIFGVQENSEFIEQGFNILLALNSLHNQEDLKSLMKGMKSELAIYVEDKGTQLKFSYTYPTDDNLAPIVRKVAAAASFILENISDILNITIGSLADTIEEQHFEIQGPPPLSEIDTSNLYKPFPLSNIQMAYWLGQNAGFEMGGFSTHGYFEFQTKLDIQRINESFQKVIDRQPMLRAVVLVSGEQCILEEVTPYIIETIDLTDLDNDEREKLLQQERERMSHHVFKIDQWPLFELKAFKLTENDHLLYLGWDVMMIDGASIQIIGKELMQYYHNAHLVLPELELSFRDYIISQKNIKHTKAYKVAKAYWMRKIEDFPSAPLLPLKVEPSAISHPHFRPISKSFSQEEWTQLKKIARSHNVTVSALLCLAYAKVLSYWSNQQRLALNLTVFNRSPIHKDVQKIVGDFTSLIMLDVDLISDISIIEQAKKLQSTLLLGLQYRHYDGVRFLRELVKNRGSKSQVIMPFVFTSMLTGESNDGWEHIGTTSWEVYQTPQVFLDNIAIERNGGLHLIWNYVEELFEQEVIETMFAQYTDILEQILNDKTEPYELSLNNTDCAVVENYNRTEESITPATLNRLFSEQVKRTPDNTAVIYNDDVLTFGKLDMMSNQVARYLREQGIRLEDRVGLVGKRSISTIVNMLGILKAGAAYVPVDSDYPEERRKYIMENCDCKLLLEPEFYERHNLEDYDYNEIEETVGTEATAYVIYTSGSTGRPKGVIISHGAVCNTVLDMNQKFKIGEADRIIGLSSICFDLSVYDIFGALSVGAALVIVADQRDIPNVLETVRKQGVTVWNSVPAIIDLALEHINIDKFHDTIRLVLLSGDWIPLLLPEKIKRYFKKAEVISLGGATEASIWSIYYPIGEIHSEWKSIPYGMPLANQTFYVLNYRGQICPVGVEGELYIGGLGLAKGYFADEEKSRHAFIVHPSLGPLYRTGDHGRMHREGYIEFLGRKDHQIKIRGYRVELGEITNALLRHESISHAVVIDREDQQGKRYLCAYIMADQKLSVNQYREFLGEELPDYMIPQYFVLLEEMPLTPNGKINRKALPAPDYQRMEDSYIAPRNNKERILASIWEQVLGVTSIGIYDNFFENGGDSIFSIQIIAQANQVGLKLTLKQLFEYHTIAELAQVAEEVKQIHSEQGAVTGEVPLTPIQHWFFEQEHPNMHHWNQSMFMRTRDKLDTDLLRGALQSIVNHHDALRLRYEVLPNGTWKQSNQDIEDPLLLEVIKPNGLVGTAWEQTIKKVTEQHQANLNLQKGPMLRAVYFDDGDDGSGRLLLVVHHLVVDGVSWRIILEDLQTAYEQNRKGITIQLPAKSTSYKEWAERLDEYGRTSIPEDVKNYWKQQTVIDPRGLPALHADEIATEASTEQVTMVLSEEETRALLQDAPAKYRAHISEILLAALAGAVSHWANVSAMTIHVEGHGREGILEGIDISRTVGWFTSLYPVHLDITGAATPLETLKAVKEEIRRIPNKGVDYGALRYLNPEMSSVFQQQVKPAISFNYLGQFDQLFSNQSMFAENLAFNESNFDAASNRLHIVDVVGVVLKGKLNLLWMYSNKHFEHGMVLSVAENMKEKLIKFSLCIDTEAAYTVSDFPDARLSKKSLDMVMAKLLKK